jgi:hypothetical protein
MSDYPITESIKTKSLSEKLDIILEILKYDSPLWKAKENKSEESVNHALEEIKFKLIGIEENIESIKEDSFTISQDILSIKEERENEN